MKTATIASEATSTPVRRSVLIVPQMSSGSSAGAFLQRAQRLGASDTVRELRRGRTHPCRYNGHPHARASPGRTRDNLAPRHDAQARPTGARNRIHTVSGRSIDLLDPNPEDIRVEDIAHALGREGRFGNQIRAFWSVADHALHVRELILDAGRPDLAFAALHHDSHEAYLRDLLRPVRDLIGPAYEQITRRFDAAIAQALGFDPALLDDPLIADADLAAAHIEARAFGYPIMRALPDQIPLTPRPLRSHGPAVARDLFLRVHRHDARRQHR